MEITKDMMRANANDAVERGAALLDTLVPGWHNNLTGLEVGEPGNSPSLDAFIAATVNPLEQIPVNTLPVGTKTMSVPGSFEAFLKHLMGEVLTEEEDLSPVQLDLGYYGFHPAPGTISYGVGNGYTDFQQSLSEEQQSATGYCPVFAAQVLAEAWTQAIQTRNALVAAAA